MTARINCPFCNPKGRVLKSNKTAQLLLSSPRKTKGHFLSMPKRHIEKPWELTKAELQDIFELIFFVERRIIGKLGDGCDVRQHYRPFMTQSRLKVDHVHFHVVPRSLDDRIYKMAEYKDTDLFKPLDNDEAAEVAKLLG
ncbi:MAG TPA: HIT domain-containing protein [Candidatus Saccharimonadales bacterium]|nr:HIT domain-containing protein [Candidatus Saccharimonadales bacterium]